MELEQGGRKVRKLADNMVDILAVSVHALEFEQAQVQELELELALVEDTVRRLGLVCQLELVLELVLVRQLVCHVSQVQGMGDRFELGMVYQQELE